MASKKILNPRFDHWCKVYRPTGGDETHEATGEEVLYEGKCHIYEANNLRNYTVKFGSAEANREDMGCDVPNLVDTVRSGDYIDFDRYGDTAEGLMITSPIPSKMGTTFRFNRPKI